MKKNIFLSLVLALAVISLSSCEDDNKDLNAPIIYADNFLPVSCDIYYQSDTISVHFTCTDDTQLGNFNIEIHSNFDHHTHSTEAVDCEEETHQAPHYIVAHGEDEEHQHSDVENVWIYNQDFSIPKGKTEYTVDMKIVVPEDAAVGDYHFMVRLTDQAGWQTLHSVAIRIIDYN